jgi:hypothetical protein
MVTRSRDIHAGSTCILPGVETFMHEVHVFTRSRDVHAWSTCILPGVETFMHKVHVFYQE